MKPLIALVAMGLGAATVGYIVTIQTNPLAFTRLDRDRAVITATLDTLPVPAAMGVASRLSAQGPIMQIDTVTVIGRLSRPPPPSRSAALAATNPVTEVSHHTILPAPCRDGEYRLLDEARGVRLMCTHQPLK